MELIILFGVLFIALAMGVPVAFCLLAATVATALYMGTPMIAIAQQMGSDRCCQANANKSPLGAAWSPRAARA
ncbi:MAG TPA: hypothetical protein PLE81_08290 [Brevundimonas sp.]|uniref:hypothetical protein n=1 Tax=Brevundimonas sp. TaxID=1871086 RepID=UPI002BFC0265|nr:hypothetical protein [Brevundimonas sp.]HRH20620.1 hypothetical protein [Brevundimonas sp.]